MHAFWLPVRVYLEDTDAQQVVYNASYFRFMERARTDYLRDRGIDHRVLDQAYGFAIVLSSIEARFVGPGRLGDMLAVSAILSDVRGARAHFAQEIRRETSEGELLVEGRAEVACIESATGRARRWPAELFEGMNK